MRVTAQLPTPCSSAEAVRLASIAARASRHRRQGPPPACGAGSRWCRGFTLVEALVVIGIIGVLAGLLLPALSRAQARAWTVACLNNMRQLPIAWSVYALEHNDVLPPSGWDDWMGIGPTWVRGYMGYSDARMSAASDATNWAMLLEPGPGRLGPYVKSPGVYKCPADRGLARSGGRLVARVRSCALNTFLDSSPFNPEGFHKLSEITYPAPVEVWSFIDEHADTLAFPAFISFIVTWVGADGSLPAGRHQRGAGMAFADGHAARKSWSDERTLRPVTGVFPIGQPANVNNEDFRWLYRHARPPDWRYP